MIKYCILVYMSIRYSMRGRAGRAQCSALFRRASWRNPSCVVEGEGVTSGR